jgi:phospholipase C
MVLRPGESDTKSWSLAPMRGWYDLVITVDGDAQFEHRLSGHLENGDDSISDPAMGGLV